VKGPPSHPGGSFTVVTGMVDADGSVTAPLRHDRRLADPQPRARLPARRHLRVSGRPAVVARGL